MTVFDFSHSNTPARRWLNFILPALVLILSYLATISAKAASEITLNLKDTDIQALIETVAAVTGKNFIVDPRVKGKVTVVSARPMGSDEIYDVFLSVLQVYGFAAVESGEVIKILPNLNATKQGEVQTTDSTATGDQVITRVIKIQHVAAAQLVPILRPLIPQEGHLAASADSNVLVISDRASNISRVEKIIYRIDRPDGQEIEVVPLQHASANEVVRIINTLQRPGAGGGVQGLSSPIMAADERTNSILLSGDEANRVRLRGLIAHLDTPIEGSGNTNVVFLKYSQAEEIAPILQGIADFETKDGSSSAGSGAASERNDVDIQADPSNNALIITASPSSFESLRRVITQLDVRRAQVLVESIIAEVSNDLSRDLGTEFFIAPTSTDEEGAQPAIGNFNTGTLLNLIADPISTGTGALVGGADFDGSTQWAFLIRALEGDSNTNILSTPTLVTLDNEEAEIVVAQNVPFITGQFTNTGSGTDSAVNPFQTIERQDVGITLRITPQINEGSSIKLDIEQESSSLSGSAVASDIITNERRITTSVLVDDGQVLVLGGLTEDNYRDTQNKVPLLGDIPLFGNLFKSTSTSKTKQNLMVFIHPVILRDKESSSLATNAKYGYLQARQLEADIQNRGLIKSEYAQFPDLDKLITNLPNGTQQINPSSRKSSDPGVIDLREQP